MVYFKVWRSDFVKVTIKDVAREANVAPSTVSRVLSDSPKISEETKIKVNKAIKKLNYKLLRKFFINIIIFILLIMEG